MDRRDFIQKAAALGLTVGSSQWSRVLAAPLPSAEAKGYVSAEGQPVAGVRVSDGYRVATTDGSGQFTIPVGPESGPFLFITVPSGYWTDQSYAPTSSALNSPFIFRLSRRDTGDCYRAVYLTDVHLGEGRADLSYARFEATLNEINRMDPLPAFCWVGGDITLQGGKGVRYVELMSKLKMPVRNAVGNHEMLVQESAPRDKFQRLFGPTYYSFDVGKVHYVTLDGCRVNRQAEGYKNVEGLLSQSELHWLKEDLRRVPEEMATVVAIHIPLVSDYAERRGTSADKVPYWIVQNAEEVVDLLARYGAALVLQGHLHENQRIVRQGIEFVESISVCGRWWKAPPDAQERGVSGEPRGYRILEVDGSSVRHQYHSSAESSVDAVGEIVGKPTRLKVGQDAILAVNIYDATAKARVSAQVDEGAFQQLSPSASTAYHENLRPAHHWEWKIPATVLAPGPHVLRVRVAESGRPPHMFQHRITV